MTLAVVAYAAVAVFYAVILSRWSRWLCTPNPSEIGFRLTAASLALAVWDIFSLRRLFIVNKPLWIGQWLFHWSFILVVANHVRFIMYQAPQWVAIIRPISVAAGYVLPSSILYILIVRHIVQRGQYVTTALLPATLTIFTAAVTGIMLHTLWRMDTAAVKEFTLRVLAFSPGPMPDGPLFAVHFMAAMLLLPLLPSHVTAAPFAAAGVRARDTGGLLNDR